MQKSKKFVKGRSFFKTHMKTLIIAFNVLLFCGIFVLVLYQGGNLSGKAVADFQETNSSIQDYYQKTIDINYETGLEKEIEFYVFNTEHRNMKVLLTVQGDLNNSVALYDSLVDFLPSDSSKNFKYKFKMPGEIENEPGLHKAEIVALEIPNISPGEDYVSSSSKTVSELDVHVSYPGKYVDCDLDILDAEQNGTAKFAVYSVNRGKEDIQEVNAKIDVYTLLGEKIASLETNSKNLSVGQTSELSANWDVNSSVGDYIAKYTVFYDGETREFEKKFAVGAKNLTIEGFLVNNFQLGGIAKLQILVDNKWNQELTDVYADLIIYNSEGQTLADIKSSSESIPTLSKKELIAYWDTANVDEGEYNAKLTINYENKTATKDIVLRVSQNSLDVFGVGDVIRPNATQGTNITTVLLILVVLLLIVNFAWFIFFRRTLWKKKQLKKNMPK